MSRVNGMRGVWNRQTEKAPMPRKPVSLRSRVYFWKKAEAESSPNFCTPFGCQTIGRHGVDCPDLNVDGKGLGDVAEVVMADDVVVREHHGRTHETIALT